MTKRLANYKLMSPPRADHIPGLEKMSGAVFMFSRNARAGSVIRYRRCFMRGENGLAVGSSALCAEWQG